MFDLFGQWEDFGLAEVRAFFKDAGDEGATWEAKADKIHADHIKEAASAFGNSRQGGYLILGATQDDAGRWSVPGVTLRDEAPKWIGSVLQTGVQPMPEVQVRSLPLRKARRWPAVVVVRIPPVALPPCITRPQGRIFERTTGFNRPVTEPSDLARLYDRGAAAVSRAGSLASTHADTLVSSVPGQGQKGMFSVAMAPVAMTDAPDRAIFSAGALSAVESLIKQLRPHPQDFAGFDVQFRQHQMFATVTKHRNNHPYGIAIDEDGWAGVALGYGEGYERKSTETYAEFRHGGLALIWETCLKLVGLLDPIPPIRVEVRVRDRMSPPFQIGRWIDSTSDDAQEPVRESVMREYLRALGHRELEEP